MMDLWHGSPEVYDDRLDAEIHRMNYEIRINPNRLEWGPKGTKYFSPSSANSCKRELYMKLSGADKDAQRNSPHQGRWQRSGTAFGDTIQRDLLFIEKHYERVFGTPPPFVPVKTDRGYPMWENFAQMIKTVEHNGHTIRLLGKPDGVLQYKDGKRVGLEIKSKQTTAAQTSEYTMREPKSDHVKQVISYSIMYGVDDFLIVYGNLSKKAWDMTEEDYGKNPDLRAFHVHVTEADRQELLDGFAEVLQAIKDGNPPPLNLDKWTFNSFKTVCAQSLTESEFLSLEQMVHNVKKSRLPDWKKQGYIDALEFIKAVRDV
jgi:hypothetical protein